MFFTSCETQNLHFCRIWVLNSYPFFGCSSFPFTFTAAAAAKSLQSCPTLRDPIDGSPPGSPVPGILQARTLEWVAISFSDAGKWEVKVKSLSRVRLLATPWTSAQAPPSMGFSRQEYWSGVPLPSPFYALGNQKNRRVVARGWAEDGQMGEGGQKMQTSSEKSIHCWNSTSFTAWWQHLITLYCNLKVAKTWFWVDSGSWWWTGRPGVLRRCKESDTTE